MNYKEWYTCDECNTYSGCDSYYDLKNIGWYVSKNNGLISPDVVCIECLKKKAELYDNATISNI